jgi:hypothetical protein
MNVHSLQALQVKGRFDLKFLLADLRRALRKDFEPRWTLIFVASPYGSDHPQAMVKGGRSENFHVGETRWFN